MPALREIFASFGVEFRDGALRRGARAVAGMENRLRDLGVTIGAGFVAHEIGQFVNETVRTGVELSTLSQRLRISSTDLQRWQHAAELSGASADDMAEALSELQVKAYEAAIEGSSDMREHFDRLGVSLTDQQGNVRDTSALMEDFIRALSETEDATVQLGAADALMSEEGKRLLPFFRQGPEAIERYRAELDALGGGSSEQFVQRAAEMGQSMVRFRAAMASLRSTITVLLVPSLNRGIRALTGWLGDQENIRRSLAIMRPLMVGLGTVAAAAAVRAAAAWAATVAPILLVAVAIGVLYLAAEDLWTTWRGGDSILRRFINELFPGMVGGLDATDRAIMAVTAAIGTVISALQHLGEVAAPMADIITAPFRPLMAVLGAFHDIGSGRGVGDTAARFAGRMTSDVFGLGIGGERGALIGYDPEAAGRTARREGSAAAFSRLTSGAAFRGESHAALVESLRPAHLRAPARTERAVTRIAQENHVELNIHDAGILSPEEAARLARREVGEALDRTARESLEALVPGPLRSDAVYEGPL